ncbi:MAG: thioredoxin domain-containing protein, partial [Longimicrobiales bacterium]
RSSTEAYPSAGEAPEFSSATVEDAVAFAARSYDAVHGGFGGAPKFPQPVVLDLLLRSGAGANAAGSGVAMATHTLKQMAAGGMRDHLGGGFHRYSVDAKWLVPHFEKMLYDNVLLARCYADASLLTGDPGLGRVATEVLDDMIDDLGSGEGPFYSARDADSEGEEGTFYLWTPDQLSDGLDPDVARLFARCYDVSAMGNFEGKNILHLPHDLDAVARDEGMARYDLDRVLSTARQTLKDLRAEREAPLLDDKVLTSWNGMAIRALAEVGAALNRPDLLARASQAASFVLEASADEDRLFHVYGGGRRYIPGFLEDYGAMGNACISLFEATLDTRWIQEAEWMAGGALEQFWSESESAFYDTAVGSEPLVVRPRDIMDNATPSGNSLVVELLLRLGAVTGEERFREPAIRVLTRELGVMQRYPTAVARLGVAGILAHTPKLEVTLVGPPEDVGPLLEEAHRHFHPNRMISGGDPTDPRVRSMPALEGRTKHGGSAFVCLGSACQEPVSSAAELADQLARVGV